MMDMLQSHAAETRSAVVPSPLRRFSLTPSLVRLILLVTIVVYAVITFSAMRRTSTTFDEIVMMAGGARGYETGDWKIAPEHPPFTQYLYGLPVFLSGPEYPDESWATEQVKQAAGYRYEYSRRFFFRSGNDPERLAMLGRLPAVLSGVALLLLVFTFTRRAAGSAAALLATWVTAFLPDLLAHGGVAYNDVPVTAALLGAAWALDEVIRSPSVKRGLLAGFAVALALGVKNSAIVLAPIAAALLFLQILNSFRDKAWFRSAAVGAISTIAGTYLGLVLIYRGDFLLTEWRYSISWALFHATEALVPAFLLGERSLTGWWYFFPVAFLFKTSAALHLLVAAGIIALAAGLLQRPRALFTSRLRVPLAGLGVMAATLLTSSLNIGFRYAMPALPMLSILVAAGLVRSWPALKPWLRGTIAVAVAWYTVHTVSYYPYFHAYISEYGPGRDQGNRVLVDSSLDWGQGLIALREYMKLNGIDRVYLSYFGSAYPEGYGIRYLPLHSFFDLPRQPNSAEAPPPRYVVISATNLNGVYFPNDPYARFRESEPEAVIAHTMFVYRVAE